MIEKDKLLGLIKILKSNGDCFKEDVACNTCPLSYQLDLTYLMCDYRVKSIIRDYPGADKFDVDIPSVLKAIHQVMKDNGITEESIFEEFL